VEKLISLLFFARDYAHKVHLTSDSYSDHMALNEFYEEIVELTDDLAEAWMGKYGALKDVPIMTNKPTGDAGEVLKNQVEWIEKNRYKVCEKDEAALQSLVDSIVVLYYSTIYKLTRFK
jgi:hypothetical protein